MQNPTHSSDRDRREVAAVPLEGRIGEAMRIDTAMSLESLARVGLDVGKKISLHRKTGLDIFTKEDGSFVTSGDFLANGLLHSELSNLVGLDTPVTYLSEESLQPSEARKEWSRFWIVDPIDGTSHYIDGRDDYTILIALVDRNEVLLSALIIPEEERAICAASGLGAFEYSLQGEQLIPSRLAPLKAFTGSDNRALRVARGQTVDSSYPEFFEELEKKQGIGQVEYEWGVGFGYGLLKLLHGELDCIMGNKGGIWDVAAAVPIVKELSGECGSIVKAGHFDFHVQDMYVDKNGGFCAARKGILY